ncbi:hypothetical protein HBI37_166030 [Parastagonospora nodorum]|nr:hypothetical protein HBH42_187440 [Parastagonospora nodorum]KAH4863314.1 hypothetical protein HBH75_004280 [Parastagonospora nodorum]KAH5052759.1 hypothetical protein HBH96_158320 [Parastagonospora nodorum]KAH5637268.1 hypothetical protein HBI51_159090 [Parastagonospora nodorum]KAH5688178.1 hypothetical protein HBI44_189240 [Parastagonospora nodorum]
MATGSALAGGMSCMLKRCAVECRPRPAFDCHGRVFWRASRRWFDPAKHASPQSRLASRLVFFPSTRPATVASNPCRPASRPYNAGANSWARRELCRPLHRR